MLDLLHLKTFMSVVATMSFSRAAKDLDCSQSTVTHQIKGLERELGVKLIDRFRFAQQIALTDAGRHAYLYAKRLLALAEEAKVAVQPVPSPQESGKVCGGRPVGHHVGPR